jgi:hypothetical protein
MAPYSDLLIDCVQCEHYGFKNWLKYFAIALLPLTLFYILAVFLSWNITSSSFSGIVVVAQCIASSPLRSKLYLLEGDRNTKYLGRIFTNLIDVINLYFFRSMYTPFCIHPNINVLEILSLDYIIALYPFLLIFFTYALISAYDKQYRVLVWMWRPFKKCFHRYRSSWDIHTSLIEIFTSVILLSSVRILQASFKLLSCIPTYDVAGNKLGYVVFLSANVKCFSLQHLPYALLAIAISLVFVIFPAFLLAVYPCGCFQKCLNRCGLRLLSLHVFMDAFQGSYRIQPRDMRSFSAFYLLLRLILLVHTVMFLSPQTFYISGIISLASAALVALVQPYKVKRHNAMDSILLLLMGIFFVSDNEVNLLATLFNSKPQWTFASVIQALSLFIIIGYFCSLVLWKMLHEKFVAVLGKLRLKFSSSRRNSNREITESFGDDRTTDSYPPLLPENRTSDKSSMKHFT